MKRGPGPGPGPGPGNRIAQLFHSPNDFVARPAIGRETVCANYDYFIFRIFSAGGG